MSAPGEERPLWPSGEEGGAVTVYVLVLAVFVVPLCGTVRQNLAPALFDLFHQTCIYLLWPFP